MILFRCHKLHVMFWKSITIILSRYPFCNWRIDFHTSPFELEGYLMNTPLTTLFNWIASLSIFIFRFFSPNGCSPIDRCTYIIYNLLCECIYSHYTIISFRQFSKLKKINFTFVKKLTPKNLWAPFIFFLMKSIPILYYNFWINILCTNNVTFISLYAWQIFPT